MRIISCLLPKQSLWLNAIEPEWIHSKRKVVEPDRLLGAYELPTGFAESSAVSIRAFTHSPRVVRLCIRASLFGPCPYTSGSE